MATCSTIFCIIVTRSLCNGLGNVLKCFLYFFFNFKTICNIQFSNFQSLPLVWENKIGMTMVITQKFVCSYKVLIFFLRFFSSTKIKLIVIEILARLCFTLSHGQQMSRFFIGSSLTGFKLIFGAEPSSENASNLPVFFFYRK